MPDIFFHFLNHIFKEKEDNSPVVYIRYKVEVQNTGTCIASHDGEKSYLLCVYRYSLFSGLNQISTDNIHAHLDKMKVWGKIV